MELREMLVALGVPAVAGLWKVYQTFQRRNTMKFDLDYQKQLSEQGHEELAKHIQRRIEVMVRREYVPGPAFPVWRVGFSLYLLTTMLIGAATILPDMLKWLGRGPKWDEWFVMVALSFGAIFLFVVFVHMSGDATGAVVGWLQERKKRDDGKRSKKTDS